MPEYSKGRQRRVSDTSSEPEFDEFELDESELDEPEAEEEPPKPSPFARHTNETLPYLSTEELMALGREVKDLPEEKTLFQAILTVLETRRIYRPKF